MEDDNLSSSDQPPKRRGFGVLAVLLLVLIAAVPSLLVRDLWSEEEILLTEGAREMVVLSDWRVPRLNGVPIGDRPPLPYWATALLWEAGGGLLSARLLSGLSVGALLIICYFATGRAAGRRAGLLTACIALTTASAFWHIRTGGPSPVLALWTTAAVLAGHRAGGSSGSGAFGWWLLAWAAMGVAALSGGVLGFVLPAATLIVYAAIGGVRRPRLLPHLAGAAVFCAVICVWAATCGEAADILSVLTGDMAGLWETVREGEVVESAIEGVLALLPWVVLLPAVFMPALRKPREGAGLRALAAVWLAVLAIPVLLGGESDYSWAVQAAVPVAILCATAIDGAAGELRGRLRRLTGVAIITAAVPAAGILLLGLLHLAGLSHLLTGQSHVCPVTMQPYSPWSLAAALPFMVIAFLLLLHGLFRKPPTALGRAVALISAMLLAGFAGDLFLSPVADAYVSARPFAEMVAREVDEGDALYLFRKDYDGIYNLHTGRVRIPVVESAGRLEDALEEEGAFVIAEEKRVKRAGLLDALEERNVAGGNVGGDYMVLLRGGAQ